jgi:hypothetical protein
MLRTVAILVAGVPLAFIALGGLSSVVIALPQNVRIYAYYIITALTGSVVGLFVGFLQKYKAGLVALTCLVPSALLP